MSLHNRNILLTGKSGVGKTTAIKHIIEKINDRYTSGFWSNEINEAGRRVGFSIETLSGKFGILAHVNLNIGPKVSRYRVNLDDIDSIIIPELEMARKSGRIIIIDEIAKMELFSESFASEVRKCLETKRVVGTIQEQRHPFLDEVRSRSDVDLFKLTTINRNQIPVQILELLQANLSPSTSLEVENKDYQ
jgi:nucleoside-triphosphatase